ncbi:hypothetical protein [Paraburkholderia tropica]|uniref:hypothetical protein n=1 Tax=Paraburkholderia tropica TaxID=92647 RepID=UPI003D2C711C
MEITTQKILKEFGEKVSDLQSYVFNSYVSAVADQYESMNGIKNWGAAKSRVKQSIKTSLAVGFLQAFANHCEIEFSYGVAMKLSKEVCDSVSSASIAKRLGKFDDKKSGRNKASIEFKKIGANEVALMQEAYGTALENVLLSIKLAKSRDDEPKKVRKI